MAICPNGVSPATPCGGWQISAGTGVYPGPYALPVSQEFPFLIILSSPQIFYSTLGLFPDGTSNPNASQDFLYNPAICARFKRDPVFSTATPPGCDGLFDDATGNNVAADPLKRARILAQMIPERTLGAGGAGGCGVNSIGTSVQVSNSLIQRMTDNGHFIDAIDMQNTDHIMVNGWVPGRNVELGDGWHNCDIREVAYLYVWKAWQTAVDRGNLNKEP